MMRSRLMVYITLLLFFSNSELLYGQSAPLKDSKDAPRASGPQLAANPVINLPTVLPKELLPHDNPKEHMLVKTAMQMNVKGYANHSSAVGFSPKGTYVAKILPSEAPHTLRLWNCSDGAELMAKSPECDYFSVPACWSAKETQLACIDGDWLRIWDLRAQPPTLLQSLLMPKPDSSDAGVWNSITWEAEDSIIVSRIAWGSHIRSHLRLLQRKGTFAPDGPQIVPPKEFFGTFTFYSDLAVSPDGASTSVLTWTGGHKSTLRILDSPTGKEVTSIEIPPSLSGFRRRFPSDSMITAHRFIPDPNRVTTMEFVPGGKTLLLSLGNAFGPSTQIVRAVSMKPAGRTVDIVSLDEAKDGDSSYSPLSFSRDGTLVGGLLQSVAQ